MRHNQRAAFERRLATAEVAIARRMAKRVAELLAAEWQVASPTDRAALQHRLARVRHLRLPAADALRAALDEIALGVPEIAARVAAQIGLEIFSVPSNDVKEEL